MILVIDNFDSFVYNLARYFEELGETVRVVRNDAVSIADIVELAPRAVVLSPGPCTPAQAGVSVPVVRELGSRIPIFGVCLGHQAIGAAYGARIERGEPFHGRVSEIHHSQAGIFRGLPAPFRAARYHSLVVGRQSLPSELEVTAELTDGTVMAIQHRRHPVAGVQFHPESVLTDHGHELLRNFLKHATGGTRRSDSAAARVSSAKPEYAAACERAAHRAPAKTR